MAAVLLMAGCREKEAPAPVATHSDSAAPVLPALDAPRAPVAAPAPPGSPAAAPAATAPKEVKPALSMSDIPPGFDNTAALNMVIENFTSEHGRLPRDLNELVTMKAIQRLPEAPAGKRFTLEDGRAKLVPQ